MKKIIFLTVFLFVSQAHAGLHFLNADPVRIAINGAAARDHATCEKSVKDFIDNVSPLTKVKVITPCKKINAGEPYEMTVIEIMGMPLGYLGY